MNHEVYLALEDLGRRMTVVEVYLNYLIKNDKLPKVSDEELAKFAEEEEKKEVEKGK